MPCSVVDSWMTEWDTVGLVHAFPSCGTSDSLFINTSGKRSSMRACRNTASLLPLPNCVGG